MSNLNLKLMNQLLQKPESRGVSFLKLSPGTHTFRLLPPYDENGLVALPLRNYPPFVAAAGKNVMPLSWGFIHHTLAQFKDELLADVPLTDMSLYDKYGDPLSRLAGNLYRLGRAKEAQEQLPRTRVCMAVVHVDGPGSEETAGQAQVWTVSQQLFDGIKINLELDENLVDPKKGRNFVVKATGMGLQRRYSAPQFLPKASAVEVPDTLPNLLAVAKIGVYDYMKQLGLLKHNRTAFTPQEKFYLDGVDDGLLDLVEKQQIKDDDIPF